MRPLTVAPGVPGSARLDDVPEPDPSQGDVLIQARALGVCGTDRDILRGEFPILWAPETSREWICSANGHALQVAGHTEVARLLATLNIGRAARVADLLRRFRAGSGRASRSGPIPATRDGMRLLLERLCAFRALTRPAAARSGHTPARQSNTRWRTASEIGRPTRARAVHRAMVARVDPVEAGHLVEREPVEYWRARRLRSRSTTK